MKSTVGSNQINSSSAFRNGISPTWRLTAVTGALALMALVVSGYLAWAGLTSSKVAGCGGGFDCDHVLSSKWSSVFGIPVGVFAATAYATMLGALGVTLFTSRGSGWNRNAWKVIMTLGLSAGIAAVWFVALQQFEIGKWCLWCLIAHSCGVLIAITLLIRRPFPLRTSASLTSVAAAGVAGLMAVQLASPEPPKHQEITHVDVTPSIPVGTTPENVFGAPDDEDAPADNEFLPPTIDDAEVMPPAGVKDLNAAVQQASGLLAVWRPSLATALMGSVAVHMPQEEQEGKQESGNTQTADGEAETRRLVSIRGGAIQLDPKDWPLLGDPAARHIFVEMFDYACPHCRNTHRAIRQAQQTLGEELAIIVLPVPLNRACNDSNVAADPKFAESCEVARLAVACWRADAKKFEDFHHWMFEGPTSPSYAAAKRKAEELLGKEVLDAQLAKKAPAQYVAKHVELYKRVNAGTIPKLLFRGTTVEGEYSSGTALVDLIRRHAN